MKQEWIDRPEAGSAFGYKLFSTLRARCAGARPRGSCCIRSRCTYLIRRGPERRASRAYLERVSGRPGERCGRWRGTFTASPPYDRSIARSCCPSASSASTSASTASTSCAHAWAQQQGVLVFGSHLGSFDALRVLAQFRPDVKMRVVIDVEQNPALSQFLNALNPELARSIINARQDGTTTALAIKEALDEKALVTLLVDRARPGNEVVHLRFPRAPRAVSDGALAARGGAQGAGGAVLRPVSRRQSLRPVLRDVRRHAGSGTRAARAGDLQGSRSSASPTGWRTTRASPRTIGSTSMTSGKPMLRTTAAGADDAAGAVRDGARRLTRDALIARLAQPAPATRRVHAKCASRRCCASR